MSRVLSILLIFVFLSSSLIVSAQENDYQDADVFDQHSIKMQVSHRIIAIGQTLWINVTGMPNQLYTIVLTSISLENNTEYIIDGMTNSTGQQTKEITMAQTRTPGTYVIALVLNRTNLNPGVVYDTEGLEIIYDPIMNLQIQIWDQKEINRQQNETIAQLQAENRVVIDMVKDCWPWVFFVVCFCMAFLCVFVYLYHPDWINRALRRWETKDQVNTIRNSAYHCQLNIHRDILGGHDVYMPGEEKRMPGDAPDDLESLKGKSHDDVLKEINSVARGLPGYDDIPKFKEPKSYKDIRRAIGMPYYPPEYYIKKERFKAAWKAGKMSKELYKLNIRKIQEAYK